jgi:hypothetical protein
MLNVNHVYLKFHCFVFILYSFILVRRTLQINLNEEERAEVFGDGNN